jgi:REP element-mobilizing transposase RayT
MPQSLSAVYAHLIFSTKDRHPWLRDPGLRGEVHAYLGGISKKLECPPIIVGGVEDHVHVVARLGRTISQAEWVKEVKRVSSAWIKKREAGLEGFTWQSGYGVFSVSASRLDALRDYVARQEEHHQRVSFQDELRVFLRKYDLEWDERHVWE